MREVHVTGIGCVIPGAVGVLQLERFLARSVSSLRPVTVTVDLLGAVVEEFDPSPWLHARERRRMNRIGVHAAAAARMALEDARISVGDLNRERTGIVVGTGDLSELALGFATFAGDHIAMYNVNASVPKTLVRRLVRWVADHHASAGERDVLNEVLETPVSPELVPPESDGAIAQRTEEIVGPYELADFFLFCLLRLGAGPAKMLFLARRAFGSRYDEATLRRWLRLFIERFFDNQFKRSVMPDGPKVGSVSLSPRGDWRMPSDASKVAWLRALDEEGPE